MNAARPVHLLFLFLVGVAAGGCSNAGGPPADAGLPPDGGSDPDALPSTPRACQATGDCADGDFCGLASRTCVSAVREVVAGAHHSCALHRNGDVSCWGLAESINAGGATVRPPTRLPELKDARALSAGTHLTCAVTAEGGVRCWGNQSMEILLPDGRPLAEATGVSVGARAACATNPQGVHCWGQNSQGQLARPVEVDASAHALLAVGGRWPLFGVGLSVVSHDGAGRVCAWGNNATHVVAAADDIGAYFEPVCGTIADVVGLTVGADHACARHSGGGFSCWGERYYGQLGLGGTDADTADIVPHGNVTTLAAPAVSLVAGVSHTCALLEDGVVTCFGLNSLGQVGPNPGTAAEEVRTPATVSGLGAAVLSLGAGSSAQHTCAVLQGGSVRCWGNNGSGQLGSGATSVDATRFSAQPVDVRW